MINKILKTWRLQIFLMTKSLYWFAKGQSLLKGLSFKKKKRGGTGVLVLIYLSWYVLGVCFCKIYFYVNGDFVCRMSVQYMSALCLLRPEEGIRSLGVEKKKLWAIMWVLGIETGSSGRVAGCLNYVSPERFLATFQ